MDTRWIFVSIKSKLLHESSYFVTNIIPNWTKYPNWVSTYPNTNSIPAWGIYRHWSFRQFSRICQPHKFIQIKQHWKMLPFSVNLKFSTLTTEDHNKGQVKEQNESRRRESNLQQLEQCETSTVLPFHSQLETKNRMDNQSAAAGDTSCFQLSKSCNYIQSHYTHICIWYTLGLSIGWLTL